MPLNLTRSLLVILIPGTVALAPYLLWLIDTFPTFEEFYGKYPQLVLGALFVAAAIWGTVQEILASRLEVAWDDERDKDYKVYDNWYDYLARICETEPVAHGYLSRMYTSMYFELTMAFAVLFFGIGMTFLFELWNNAWWCYAVFVIFVSFGACVWFAFSARESHKVLCKTRMEINKRLGQVKPTA